MGRESDFHPNLLKACRISCYSFRGRINDHANRVLSQEVYVRIAFARGCACDTRGTMSHLMSRRETAFTLWRPARTAPAPKVRIVSFVPGNPPSESLVFEGDLALTDDPDIWTLPIQDLPLVSGQVYEYWFIVVNDTSKPEQLLNKFSASRFTRA